MPRYTPEQKTEMVRMYLKGALAEEVMQAFGCSHMTVAAALREAGVPPRSGPGSRSRKQRLPLETRLCNDCGKVGRVGEDFRKKAGNVCKVCTGKRDAAWRIAVQEEGGERHERRKEQMRLAQAVKKYGLTHEEARRLYDTDACQICGKPNPTQHRLNIDHCHATGAVRGVLCINCNRGLGFFGDDPDLLEAAATYIRTSLQSKLGLAVSASP